MSCEQKVDLRQKAPENWSIATPVMPGSVDLAMQAGKLLDDVRTALDFDLGAAIRATAKLAALLGGNRGEMPPAGPALGGLAPWQKRKVRNHIERHIDLSIPVKDLAELVSLSTGHFCRAFKESFGDTPHAYVMRMRLERAQELMLASPEPLGQIALACGHSDQAHFSRRFRQQVGESPNAWRRRHATGGWASTNRRPNRGTNSSAQTGLPGGVA